MREFKKAEAETKIFRVCQTGKMSENVQNGPLFLIHSGRFL